MGRCQQLGGELIRKSWQYQSETGSLGAKFKACDKTDFHKCCWRSAFCVLMLHDACAKATLPPKKNGGKKTMDTTLTNTSHGSGWHWQLHGPCFKANQKPWFELHTDINIIWFCYQYGNGHYVMRGVNSLILALHGGHSFGSSRPPVVPRSR